LTGDELVARAEAAAANAYAPYSRYLVGASVLTKDGRVFDGVNVENAAYPLGICAERSAIAAAAGAGLRPGEVDAIGITASPCGGCRQWLHEWRFERVFFRRDDGSLAEYPPDALLPDTWDLPER
jgi:cytidine deaminase